MSAGDAGLQLLHRLNLVGQLMPDPEEMARYTEACDREDAIGPLFYPDAHRQAAGRMRAARNLCRAGVKFARAYAELQEVTGREADPELDAAAEAIVRGFHRKTGGAP